MVKLTEVNLIRAHGAKMSAVSNCVQKLTKGLFPLRMIKIVEERRGFSELIHFPWEMCDCSCWGQLSDSSVSSSNYSKFYPETSQFFNSTRFLRISFNSCCRLQKALKFLLKRIVDIFTLSKITIVYLPWYINVEEIQILERFGEFWTNKKNHF